MRPFYFTVLSCLFYVSTFLITVNCNIFVENFEQNSLSKWNLFEELVTTCYGENIGTIELNSFAAYEGLQGMVVWSNKNKTKGISNHIIAGNKVFSGVEGRWRYSLHAQIPLASFETTQVGPEFSVQNTRDDGTNTGTTSTDIFGIQYVASKWLTEKWKIWVTSSTVGVAEWISLSPTHWSLGTQPLLTADIWYQFILDMDYDTLHYISLTVIDDTNGLVIDVANLTELVIAKEPRSWESATVLTVEGENLFGNCGEHGPFESKLYYDKLLFRPITPDSDSESDMFALSWEYEFTKHVLNYTDAQVLSWDFNVYQGEFGSSSNAYFMKDHAVTSNGQLVLTIDNATNLADPSRDYTSGGVNTAEWANHAQIYGKWEVEAQFPVGFGVTGYIGLFRTDKVWPPEVDFAEVIGREPSRLFLTQHYVYVNVSESESEEGGGTNHVHVQSGSTIEAASLGLEGSEEAWGYDFHVYGIEWTETELKYFVDGALVWNETVKFSPELMDVAVGTGTGDCGSWVDCPENAAANGFDYPLPAQMVVNWIKVYEYHGAPSIPPTVAPSADSKDNNCFPVSYGWHS